MEWELFQSERAGPEFSFTLLIPHEMHLVIVLAVSMCARQIYCTCIHSYKDLSMYN